MSEEIASALVVAVATLVAIFSWVNSGKKADGFKVFGFVFVATIAAEYVRSQYVGERTPFVFILVMVHFVLFGIPTAIVLIPVAKFLYDLKHKSEAP